ncbi:MAG: DUF1553 domain-containing protein [Gemmatales bacterium]|nr:DUF1553 domain-containing protein [Gemmatales bacterium]
MRSTVAVMVGFGAWFLGYGWGVWIPAQQISTGANQSKTIATAKPHDEACGPLSAAELAGVIDKWIEKKWQEEQVKPSELADDAEFVRRLYLDLVGRIPSVAEARSFLDNTSPNKRADLIRQLLRSPGFLNRWSGLLAETWLSNGDNVALLNSQRALLQTWIREHMRLGSGYDKIVAELLSASTSQQNFVRRPEGSYRSPGSPVAFLQGNGFNPRNLAASVSRQFLGIQLDCAECHNHPFANWKREQFWQLAAFFAGFRQQRADGQVFYTNLENPKERTIQIPDTNITVTARFLDGSEPNWESAERTRELLARWITSPTNPYFAKATVNRVWYQLMGYGLTDPPDDMHEENPPSHPELLEALARAFVEARFDLRYLIEAVCLSRTYQLSSRRTDPSQDNARLLARRVVRRMTATQLWDSLVEAAYWNPSEARVPQFFDANVFVAGMRPNNFYAQRRQAFLERFRDAASRPVEAETSVLQVLALMNGEAANSVVRLESSPMLQMVLNYPLWDDRQRLETLFLATLSRRPQPHEQTRFLRHLEQSAQREAAWADVLWVLLNSPEFISHH